MESRDLADRIVRATLALAEAPLRAAYVRGLIVGTAPTELAPALDALCARAEQVEPRARECLMSVVDAMAGAEPDLREALQRLREEAAGESHLALERLLRAVGEEPGRLSDPTKERVPDYGKGRPLTLGERKSLARKPDRELMSRLLLDPHPDVIHRLLANPKLTEDDVVRLASKRPCRPDVLAEIARSEKWMHRPRVRISVVLNPATPVEIATPIVSLLMRQELRMVAEASAVSRAVRALCVELLERRPPVDRDDDDDARVQ
jgi:hypothetical protein